MRKREGEAESNEKARKASKIVEWGDGMRGREREDERERLALKRRKKSKRRGEKGIEKR